MKDRPRNDEHEAEPMINGPMTNERTNEPGKPLRTHRGYTLTIDVYSCGGTVFAFRCPGKR
jgi:hypothetical protein